MCSQEAKCFFVALPARSYVAKWNQSEPLALVHNDVCGPMLTLSMGGAAYFVTFIDDCSRKAWVNPLRRKDEVLSIFQHFVTLVET